MAGKRSFSQGEYRPKNPEKYKGTLPIIYRSSWEQRVFYFLDTHPSISEWSSESIVISYLYKVDNKPHRYYVDVAFKALDKVGTLTYYIAEIKPYNQTIPPKPVTTKNPKAVARYNREALEWQKNQDKWEAARKWADQRGYKFIILTERQLFGEK